MIDAFILMAIPQLLTIILLITLMLFWEQIVINKHVTLIIMVRLI